MKSEERYNLITRNLQGVLTESELRDLLKKEEGIKLHKKKQNITLTKENTGQPIIVKSYKIKERITRSERLKF